MPEFKVEDVEAVGRVPHALYVLRPETQRSGERGRGRPQFVVIMLTILSPHTVLMLLYRDLGSNGLKLARSFYSYFSTAGTATAVFFPGLLS